MDNVEGLEVEKAELRFGGHLVLKGVDLWIEPGEVVGLIGPNGAGKTTLLNVCSGFLTPNRGRVLMDESDVTTLSPVGRAQKGLGRTFQRMELFEEMSVEENLYLAAEGKEVGRDPLRYVGFRSGGRQVLERLGVEVEGVMSRVGVREVRDQPAGRISTGERRLVELGRALAHRPRYLLLDEPSSGLDVVETKRFGRSLELVASERDVGVLLVEHDVDLVLRVCHRVVVLDFGEVLAMGPPSAIRDSEEVKAAYLGRTNVE